MTFVILLFSLFNFVLYIILNINIYGYPLGKWILDGYIIFVNPIEKINK